MEKYVKFGGGVSLLSKTLSWTCFLCARCLFLAPLPLKLLILCNSVWEEGHKLPQPPEAAEASGWVPKRSVELSRLFIHFTFSFDFKNLHIYVSVSISELRVMPELETSGCITCQRRNIWRARQGQVHDSTQQQCGNFTQNFSLLLQQWQSAPADPGSAQTNNKRTLGTPPLFIWGCGDSANFLSDRYLSPNALLLFSFHHYLPDSVTQHADRRSVTEEGATSASVKPLQRGHLT